MAQTHKQFMTASAKKRKKAVELREQKHSMEAIGKRFGVSRQRVAQWLKLEASKP